MSEGLHRGIEISCKSKLMSPLKVSPNVPHEKNPLQLVFGNGKGSDKDSTDN